MLAIFAHKLKEPLVYPGKISFPVPQDLKRGSLLRSQDLMHPVLGYESSIWGPQGVVLQVELESVQKLAARFVTQNYNYETRRMTGILGQ